MFVNFGRTRPTTITKLKSMIQHWADEEDKAKTRHKSGKQDNNAGNNGNNNGGNSDGKQQQINRNNNYSGNPNRKRKPDNTVAALEQSSKEQNSDNPHFS